MSETSVQKRYLLKTLGCKANLYDSQLIESELRKRGWIPARPDEEASADLCIVNSCTVTDEADRQSRKTASRLSRDNPGTRVVMTGCSAEVSPEQMLGSKGVNYVVNNRDKPSLVQMVLAAIDEAKPDQILGSAEGYDELISRHPIDREWPAPELAFASPEQLAEGEASRTRAFLKIQEGCNSFCTYCIIPYGRGPSRSLPISEVVAQVKELVSKGVREIVITGTNVGDYGLEWQSKPAVTELFKAILNETQLERLRVSSLDPTEIEPELMELMTSDPRFCAHYHVSLQSPHSKILKLMKRKYAAEQVENCLNSIAEIPAPVGGVFVGMDVITGFPGETEDDFNASVDSLVKLPWSRLHVFPYSEREGTPATRLPGVVPQHERMRRAKVLRDLSLQRLESHYLKAIEGARHRGQPLQGVLVEGPVRGPDGTMNWVAGYTPNYLRVILPKSQNLSANQFVSVVPLQIVKDPASGDVSLIGELAH